MRTLCLLAVASLACATPRIDAGTAPRREPLPVDWAAAGDEAVRLLSDYLRIDTSSPPGNESRGTAFLAALLEREGIASETFEIEPGRGTLIARLKGSGAEPPLCLMHHVDTVTAEPALWPEGRGPWSGTVDEDGTIWGRGALDMKGVGVLQVLSAVWLKRLGLPLRRDVVLLAVADEEQGGRGMDALAARWKDIGCSHLLNEGGIGLVNGLFPGQTLYAVSVAEKGTLWLRMVARGEPGHGSTPVPGRAPERLVRALDRLSRREPAAKIHPAVYQTLREVGAHRGGFSGFVLSRPFLVRSLAMGTLTKKPAGRAMVFDTCQATGFAGGREPNVVPAEASATLDCRLLPGSRPADLLAELRALVDDPQVRFEVLKSKEAAGSAWDDPLFHAIVRRASAGRPEVVVAPIVSPGYTDSVAARALGVRAYGFLPFEVTAQEQDLMHGNGERVSVKNVHRGLRLLLDVVADAAVDGQAAR